MDAEETNGLVRLTNNDSRMMEKMEIGAAVRDGGVRSSRFDLRRVAILSVVALTGVILYFYGGGAPNLSATKQQQHVSFTCPAVIRDGDNYDKESFDKEYIDDQQELTANTTKFLHDFRTEGYDSWGHTYEEVKAGMHHWKQKYYPPNIRSGGSIYESACGIGLNLFMSLEILQDAGITDLVVYGNEYLPFSTEKANIVFDNAAPAGSTKGMICAGDSTDLSYVPSNAFDLVFTGYISPILDPLNLNTGDIDSNYKLYKKLCKVSKAGDKKKNNQTTNDDDSSNTWKDIKLVELAQEKQNKFYAKWISEMIRIAKPGSAVIIEQVSYPFCEEFYDWGGVNQKWWKPAVEKYGWDVEPDSIAFEEDTIFRNRYHAFMRKNAAA